MKDFARGALSWSGGVFVVEALTIAALVGKQCDDLGWAAYGLLYGVPLYYMRYPWLVALVALGFVLGGVFYARTKHYSRMIFLGWVAVAILVPTFTAIYAPRGFEACQPL